MLSKIRRLFSSYPLQTFTYFIPAPPTRKQGYREKSFDQLTQKLTKMDYRLVDIKTQAVNNNSSAGMWVIVSIKPLTKEASEYLVTDFPNEWENEELQNLAHLPTTNDNLHEGIELPQQDQSFEASNPNKNNDDESDTIEGIYYID